MDHGMGLCGAYRTRTDLKIGKSLPISPLSALQRMHICTTPLRKAAACYTAMLSVHLPPVLLVRLHLLPFRATKDM
ncbi:hypothetical protein PM082_005659 [Marasmius tenuissimus]|nr:hypothetical protein PM082_005659 [Marasmius tenuissimus]